MRVGRCAKTAMLLPVLLVWGASAPVPGTIITVAGGGNQAAGSGGLATKAKLRFPNGVAVDARGNIYIADSPSHLVARVSPDGRISRAAGPGSSRGMGDGGPATAALLESPADVAVDGLGNLYIVDIGHHRVRKIRPDGIITTVAGKGSARVQPGAFSGDGGPATEAELNEPVSVAVDHRGNIFIADRDNHRVRRVSPQGVIETVAGSGPPGHYNGGYAGDGGPAVKAWLNWPAGVAVDRQGNLFIADGGNYRVRRVNTEGIITTVAGGGTKAPGDGGPATEVRLSARSIAVDVAGSLYITDYLHNRIRKVNPDGAITTIAGTGDQGFGGDGGPAAQARLFSPYGLAVDSVGSLIIADSVNYRVRKVFSVAAPGLLAGRPFPVPVPDQAHISELRLLSSGPIFGRPGAPTTAPRCPGAA
jgi:sugar lactone lactonase YvrE